MKACGLVVEYNPFHNGHVYHLNEAKKLSKADCIVAVMSGSFLQRGEPAIIDKYHRTKAALETGIDIVLELPFIYAVQHSDLFADGAVRILNECKVDTICFGSESGEISYFLNAYRTWKENQATFNAYLKEKLAEGISFPNAGKYAYKKIGLTTKEFNLSQPNNILGFGYVKGIMDNGLSIRPMTIQRIKNHYHDANITGKIASATSIRTELLEHQSITPNVKSSIPDSTKQQLQLYKEKTGIWHRWELYFPLLQYRIMTMDAEELRNIFGVEEGMEFRIKKVAKEANNFTELVQLIKSKRFTWTRIQRMFVYILTNVKKKEIENQLSAIPYVRILGLTDRGKAFLNEKKKDITVPLIYSYHRNQHQTLSIDERASLAYYSVLKPSIRQKLFHQEIQGPVML